MLKSTLQSNMLILGEGRQIYFVGALDKNEPFKRIVGWRDDLTKADPESYAAYLAEIS